MSALGRIDVPVGIAAMNSINTAIPRPLFMPLFLGSSLAALVLAGVALFQWHQPGSAAIVAGSALDVIGMFVCRRCWRRIGAVGVRSLIPKWRTRHDSNV